MKSPQTTIHETNMLLMLLSYLLLIPKGALTIPKVWVGWVLFLRSLRFLLPNPAPIWRRRCCRTTQRLGGASLTRPLIRQEMAKICPIQGKQKNICNVIHELMVWIVLNYYSVKLTMNLSINLVGRVIINALPFVGAAWLGSAILGSAALLPPWDPDMVSLAPRDRFV